MAEAATAEQTPNVEVTASTATPLGKPAEQKSAPVDETLEKKTTEPVEKKPDEVVQKTIEEVKYELKLPEGSKVSAEHLNKVIEEAKAQKLSPEQAQYILNRDHQALVEQEQQFKKLADTWVSEVKADKEIGGEHFTESMALAKRFVDTFGDEQFRKDLEATGFGNHPGLVRLMAKAGKALSDGKILKATQPASRPKTLVERMYKDSAS